MRSRTSDADSDWRGVMSGAATSTAGAHEASTTTTAGAVVWDEEEEEEEDDKEDKVLVIEAPTLLGSYCARICRSRSCAETTASETKGAPPRSGMRLGVAHARAGRSGELAGRSGEGCGDDAGERSGGAGDEARCAATGVGATAMWIGSSRIGIDTRSAGTRQLGTPAARGARMREPSIDEDDEEEEAEAEEEEAKEAEEDEEESAARGEQSGDGRAFFAATTSAPASMPSQLRLELVRECATIGHDAVLARCSSSKMASILHRGLALLARWCNDDDEDDDDEEEDEEKAAPELVFSTTSSDGLMSISEYDWLGATASASSYGLCS